MKQRNESELLHLAAGWCSSCERCVSEVRKKLTEAGASPEVSERIITRLVEEKFMDEARFCRSFVKDRFRFNGWGRIRIRHELQQKGIASRLIAEALDELDDETCRSALSNLLKTKKRTVKGRSEYDVFRKLYRFACGRGFEGALISSCLKPLFNETYSVDEEI
ncbi:MAG: RecX family transcriptional regulator [Tannerella sp.]|jgi:regulatory protein|nr:RecX family transcriptional regulator [Tannerella sp.]